MVLTESFQFVIELTDSVFVSFARHPRDFLCELHGTDYKYYDDDVAGFRRTLLFCTSSKRFSASVFLSLATTGLVLEGPGEFDFLSSSSMSFSNSFKRLLSAAASLSLCLDLDFFFLKRVLASATVVNT